MTRYTWLPLLMTLAACAPRPAPAPTPTPTASDAQPTVCRIGPDGARPLADRGIGGTGAPVQVADRGIGGTGIIGVITGFASVCVAGEEVALPDSVPAQVDGQPASLDSLRAGQVVALQATGPADALQAQQIAVRHEVIGPVQSVADGVMTVAGQTVTLAQATSRGATALPGDWVAVSGLREPDGTISATRIDLAPPGEVLLRGDLVSVYGATQIGALTVTLPPGSAAIPSGFPVTVTGQMQGSGLVADSVARDVAADSPSSYFGPDVTSFVVEGYVSVLAGGYLVNHDFIRGSGFGAAGSGGRGIAIFTRRPQGGLEATGLRGGFGPARSFEPAPMPRAGFGPEAGPRFQDGGFGQRLPGQRRFPGQTSLGGFAPGMPSGAMPGAAALGPH